MRTINIILWIMLLFFILTFISIWIVIKQNSDFANDKSYYMKELDEINNSLSEINKKLDRNNVNQRIISEQLELDNIIITTE